MVFGEKQLKLLNNQDFKLYGGQKGGGMSWPAETECPLCENGVNTNMVLPLTFMGYTRESALLLKVRIFPCDKHRGDIDKLVEYLHRELCI